MYVLKELETPSTCIYISGEKVSRETILVNVYVPDYYLNASKTDAKSKAHAKKLNKYFASNPSVADLKKNGFWVFPCIETGKYQIRSRGYFPMCQDLSKLTLKKHKH